jgi:hypothetical protein
VVARLAHGDEGKKGKKLRVLRVLRDVLDARLKDDGEGKATSSDLSGLQFQGPHQVLVRHEGGGDRRLRAPM